MAQWYYQVSGQEIGPVTNAELRRQVRAGVIDCDTLVRKDDSKWFMARAVGGLLDQAATVAGQQQCLYCGADVQPPAKCPGCGRIVAGTSPAHPSGKVPASPPSPMNADSPPGELADPDPRGKLALLTFAASAAVASITGLAVLFQGRSAIGMGVLLLAAVVCLVSLVFTMRLNRRSAS